MPEPRATHMPLWSAHQEVFKALPHLRAFAISLTSDSTRADDLVQETILRGLTHIDRFEPGTCMRSWLFTILRNLFHTEHCKRRREVEDVDGTISSAVAVLPEQGSKLEMNDLRVALAKLSSNHREVLLLIRAQGLSYEETARICGTNVGTIKSRVNRARAHLAQLMFVSSTDDLGPDRQVQAVLAQPVAQQAACTT